MFDKIWKWLYDTFGPESEQDDNEDVTVDEAILNYQKYQEELKEHLAEYIKTTCSDIKTASRNGYKSITLDSIPRKLDSSEYLQEIKEYFKVRGFEVISLHENCNFMQTEIKISWM
jgi:hypothetical protein